MAHAELPALAVEIACRRAIEFIRSKRGSIGPVTNGDALIAAIDNLRALVLCCIAANGDGAVITLNSDDAYRIVGFFPGAHDRSAEVAPG